MTPSRILLVYTGGTIGSVEDPDTGALKPLNFDHLRNRVPEVDALEVGAGIRVASLPSTAAT